jgi:ABC-type Fe3+-siderophore transport system permease subunit
MMDELELLKKDWKRQEQDLPKLTYEQIYAMIWKKSSSIVKWIFIISLIEFALPHLLYLLPSAREGLDYYEDLGLRNLILTLTVIQYLVVFYFIFQFYKRYQEISVLDNARELMHKILRTRRTVKNYIVFALSLFLINFIVIAIGIFFSDGDNFLHVFQLEARSLEMSTEQLKVIISGVMVAFGIICTALLGLIYFLLYGLLLRKLDRNYSELQRLEV